MRRRRSGSGADSAPLRRVCRRGHHRRMDLGGMSLLLRRRGRDMRERGQEGRGGGWSVG